MLVDFSRRQHGVNQDGQAKSIFPLILGDVEVHLSGSPAAAALARGGALAQQPAPAGALPGAAGAPLSVFYSPVAQTAHRGVLISAGHFVCCARGEALSPQLPLCNSTLDDESTRCVPGAGAFASHAATASADAVLVLLQRRDLVEAQEAVAQARAL